MAWPSQRERIILNLIDTFKKISGDPAWQLHVKTVGRDLVHPDQINDTECPAIFLTASLEDPAHKFYQRTENTLTVLATCFVRADEGDSPSQELERLLYDMRVAFYTDIQRGSNAITSLIGQTRVPKGFSPPLGALEVDCIVLYRHERIQP